MDKILENAGVYKRILELTLEQLDLLSSGELDAEDKLILMAFIQDSPLQLKNVVAELRWEPDQVNSIEKSEGCP